MVFAIFCGDTTMLTKKSEDRHEEVLGDDLLFGAPEIAAFLKRSERWVYYQQGHLGLSHVGATLIGSKTKLKKLLTGEAAP